jgi:hypothetical protein
MNKNIKTGISRKQQKHEMLLNFVANMQTNNRSAQVKNNFKHVFHVLVSLPKVLL